MKTYSEKLKDPRWQKKRLEILNRDGFACNICGGTEDTLHVHHAFYSKGKDPWDYPDSILTTLCEDCHTQVEEANRLLATITPQSFGLNASLKFYAIFSRCPLEFAELLEALDEGSVRLLSELLWRQRKLGTKAAKE